MHREFARLIGKARGRAEHAIVVYVDIRGFSAFSEKQESPNAAIYIRKVYEKLIKDYFSNATFFKPTGDGLLIIIGYDEQSLKDLKQLARETFSKCFKLLKDFPNFCKNDPMVNFSVPSRIGIGIARGIVCCLYVDDKGEKILDYSGRILNLGARLMDVARPSGIVFDQNFQLDLLTKPIREKFSKESVYVSGIAESVPLKIYYSTDLTQIGTHRKTPIAEEKWDKITDTNTVKQIGTIAKWMNYSVDQRPIGTDQINATVRFPKMVKGKTSEGVVNVRDVTKLKINRRGTEYSISVDFNDIQRILNNHGLKQSHKVELTIHYRYA